MNRFLATLLGSKTEKPPVPRNTGGPIPPLDMLETALQIHSMEEVPMWLQILAKALAALPYIVAGIQHVHGSAISGADKKQLAMEAAGVSLSVVSQVDPQHAPAINQMAGIISAAIDGTVALMHTAGEAPKALPVAASVVAP